MGVQGAQPPAGDVGAPEGPRLQLVYHCHIEFIMIGALADLPEQQSHGMHAESARDKLATVSELNIGCADERDQATELPSGDIIGFGASDEHAQHLNPSGTLVIVLL